MGGLDTIGQYLSYYGDMNVSLTPDLRRLIRERMETGLYGNESEVVREALRLYFERVARKAWMEGEIQKGLEDVAAGRLVPGTPELLEDIKRRGRERAQGKLQKAG